MTPQKYRGPSRAGDDAFGSDWERRGRQHGVQKLKNDVSCALVGATILSFWGLLVRE